MSFSFIERRSRHNIGISFLASLHLVYISSELFKGKAAVHTHSPFSCVHALPSFSLIHQIIGLTLQAASGV